MLYIFIQIYHCGLGRWWWWWWKEEGKHGHENASEMWRCNATWGRGFHQTMHLHYVAKDTHSKLTLPILLLIKVAKSVVAKKSLFMVATWLQMGEAKASPWRLKGCLKFGNLWSKLWLGPLPWVQAQTWNFVKNLHDRIFRKCKPCNFVIATSLKIISWRKADLHLSSALNNNFKEKD